MGFISAILNSVEPTFMGCCLLVVFMTHYGGMDFKLVCCNAYWSLHEIVTQLSIGSLQLQALLTGCMVYCRLYDVMEVGPYGLYYEGPSCLLSYIASQGAKPGELHNLF